MGVSLYPVIEGQTAGSAEFGTAGKPLAKAVLNLEKAAKRSDVQPLYDFFSMSRPQAIAEVLGGDPDDPSSYEEAKLPQERWFDAASGLKTISWYMRYVEEHPSKFAKPDSVLQDLREFERILSRAKSLGLRWHLGQSC